LLSQEWSEKFEFGTKPRTELYICGVREWTAKALNPLETVFSKVKRIGLIDNPRDFSSISTSMCASTYDK
jgi:hypothetical protein